MTAFSDEADERARDQAIEIEALRILKTAEEFDIPDDCLDSLPPSIECLLDLGYYDSRSIKTKAVAQSIFDPGWQRKASRMVVFGGTIDDREKIANICLARVIMTNPMWDGVMIKKTSLAQILPIFNSFESARFEVAEEMSSCAVLMLSEIPPTRDVDQRNDFRNILDMIMMNRRDAKVPTIFTLSNANLDNYKSIESLGNMFAETVNAGHVPGRHIWHLALATSGNANG